MSLICFECFLFMSQIIKQDIPHFDHFSNIHICESKRSPEPSHIKRDSELNWKKKYITTQLYHVWTSGSHLSPNLCLSLYAPCQVNAKLCSESYEIKNFQDKLQFLQERRSNYNRQQFQIQ